MKNKLYFFWSVLLFSFSVSAQTEKGTIINQFNTSYSIGTQIYNATVEYYDGVYGFDPLLTGDIATKNTVTSSSISFNTNYCIINNLSLGLIADYTISRLHYDDNRSASQDTYLNLGVLSRYYFNNFFCQLSYKRGKNSNYVDVSMRHLMANIGHVIYISPTVFFKSSVGYVHTKFISNTDLTTNWYAIGYSDVNHKRNNFIVSIGIAVHMGTYADKIKKTYKNLYN